MGDGNEQPPKRRQPAEPKGLETPSNPFALIKGKDLGRSFGRRFRKPTYRELICTCFRHSISLRPQSPYAQLPISQMQHCGS